MHEMGIAMEIARIARETRGRCGLHELKLGTWLLRQGFDVTVIAWEPPIPAGFIRKRPSPPGSRRVTWPAT